MIEVVGYRISGLLHESTRSLVYRGVHEASGRLVVIKVPRDPYPSPREVAGYERAYQLGQGLDHANVIRHLDLVRFRSAAALVTEDYGAVALSELIPPTGFELEEVLRLAVHVCAGIAALHQSGIVHKDIKPANVVVHPQTKVVKVIDFGIATLLDQEDVAVTPPEHLEGTLRYMAPEQTGRMNRPVDLRADLYAFGITLYELLVGEPPFVDDDPMDLVHGHIARRPVPVIERRPVVPKVVSDLVDRLLQKSAEDRYASALGLLHDLQHALAEVQRTGTCAPFPLAARDVSSRFRVAQKLYGRSRDVEMLLQRFEEVAEGGRVLLTVSGYSGIGKTSLVHEVQPAIVARRGWFCEGKFDQFRRDLPYAALIDAFSDLARQVLAGPATLVSRMSDDLRQAVGGTGRVLVDVMPDLGPLLGPTAEVPELGPKEAQLRFNRTFLAFVGVFARPLHPLVVFVDDLQWADFPSLQLLEALATEPGLAHLMLMGGFRDNEVDAAHSLTGMIGRVRAAGTPYVDLRLAPLRRHDVVALVSDTLSGGAEAVDALAALVYDKTGGNPFFVLELLRSLHRRGLVTFDVQRQAWTWDAAQIASAQVTDNVVELMTQKLTALAPETLDALQTAACIGGAFDLETLAAAEGLAMGSTAQRLETAIAEGLLVPVDPSYKFVEGESMWSQRLSGQESVERVRYRFRHDRVQQAAHGLLHPDTRAERHLRVGRLLLARAGSEGPGSDLIDIVNHLDEGRALITDPKERYALARLNLEAGRRASRSLAFDAAALYLGHAKELFPSDLWTHDYALALALHQEGAGLAMARGRFEDMDAHAAEVVANARSPMDRIPVYELKLRADVYRHHFDQAVVLCRETLTGLGVSIPARPATPHILSALVRTLWALGRRDPLQLADLPVCSDPRTEAVINVMASSAPAAYFSNPNLLPLLGMTASRLSMRHGNTRESPYGYAVFALLLCGVLGRIDQGYRFGQLVLKLGEHVPGVQRWRATFVVNVFVRHWKEPLRDIAPILEDNWRHALEYGDEESATYCAGVGLYNGFFSGEPVTHLRGRLDAAVRQVAGSGQEHIKHGFLAWAELCDVLGQPVLPDRLSGPRFDIDKHLPAMIAAKNGVQVGLVSLAAGLLDLLAGRFGRAVEHLERSHLHEESMVAQVVVPGLAWARSLAALAYVATGAPSGGEARRLVRRARGGLKRLRAWAKFAPFNLGSRVHLLEAELHAIEGRPGEAVLSFQRAMDVARAHGMLLDEALAAERCALHALRVGTPEHAVLYRTRARDLYGRWGARGKAAALSVDLPGASMVTATPSTNTSDSGSYDASSHTHGMGDVDLASLLKAVRTVSQEIETDRLVERAMQILLTNAGADRGALLLAEEGTLSLVAQRQADAPDAVTGPRVRLNQVQNLPISVIEYVARTQEAVLIDDARNDRRFGHDRYLRGSGVRSVLCGPVVLQGALAGVIVLENHLSAGAFTPGRMQLLEAIAGQAAVSLENARLYERVESALEDQVRLTEANERFVPRAFLQGLGRESITDVQPGDAVGRDMTVLFADIRGFTRLTERMTPDEAIRFVNDTMARLEPGISAHGGFVDHFQGDAIMALFGGEPDDGVRAGVAMLEALRMMNADRATRGQAPVVLGIGLNHGALTMGTIGGAHRLQCSVFGDTVNVAARVEGLTKVLAASFLVTDAVRAGLSSGSASRLRLAGRVGVVGRVEPVQVWEVIDAEGPAARDAKLTSLPSFQTATDAFFSGRIAEAQAGFRRCLEVWPGDTLAARYDARCLRLLLEGVPSNFSGVEDISVK